MSASYPLAWPEGWPRTPVNQQVDGRYQFKKIGNDGFRAPYTFIQARDALMVEIRKMGAGAVVLSTNFQISVSTGLPRGDRSRPADEGVALYFTRKGKPLVMACDRYLRAEENMNSLRLALEAMRQLERHGGGLLAEKAFTGFAALPAPLKWWEVLGVSATATPSEAETAYRARAREAHPDAGGSSAAMADLNAARDAARKHLALK